MVEAVEVQLLGSNATVTAKYVVMTNRGSLESTELMENLGWVPVEHLKRTLSSIVCIQMGMVLMQS